MTPDFVIIQQSVFSDFKKEYSKDLLTMHPIKGILGVLDLIFDYLSFEDLERLALVSKFFLFVATLDKLYHKYDIEEGFETFEDVSAHSMYKVNIDVSNHNPQSNDL